MTYATLKTEVANYLHRTDLTAQIPTFITLAEAYLFRELDVKELQVSVAGTTTSELGTLPTDFGTVSRITVTYQNTVRTLDYASVPIASTSINTLPIRYALENNKIRIFGAGNGQAYTLYYNPKVQALSDTVTTNWILDNGFDLYLYAACLEGAKYIRDQAEIGRLSATIPNLVNDLRMYARRRGLPVTGSLQIKTNRLWTR